MSHFRLLDASMTSKTVLQHTELARQLAFWYTWETSAFISPDLWFTTVQI